MALRARSVTRGGPVDHDSVVRFCQLVDLAVDRRRWHGNSREQGRQVGTIPRCCPVHGTVLRVGGEFSSTFMFASGECRRRVNGERDNPTPPF